MLREIEAEEVRKLQGCISGLADYHNEVSLHFRGTYPRRPVEITLQAFEKALREHTARIAVIEKNRSGIIGFCKLDVNGLNGKIDYLFVEEANRGKGYGAELMEWAIQLFSRCGVRHIEVKVIEGNPAIHLYEKYGFQLNAHILVNNR